LAIKSWTLFILDGNRGTIAGVSLYQTPFNCLIEARKTLCYKNFRLRGDL